MKDHVSGSAAPSCRTMETSIGPIQLLSVLVGTASQPVGHYYGRLGGNVPAPGLYVYFRIKALGSTLFAGCWSLG